MNKKNVDVAIKVIDEFGGTEGNFGCFEEDDLQKLVKIAEQEDMLCLSFIDLPQDTYFNELQCRDIQKELVILRNYIELDSKLLEAIYKAVELALKEESYVKFEVIQE